MPALTETATAGNVRFYERLGFAVLHDVALPEAGPRLRIMWRELAPRAGKLPSS